MVPRLTILCFLGFVVTHRTVVCWGWFMTRARSFPSSGLNAYSSPSPWAEPASSTMSLNTITSCSLRGQIPTWEEPVGRQVGPGPLGFPVCLASCCKMSRGLGVKVIYSNATLPMRTAMATIFLHVLLICKVYIWTWTHLQHSNGVTGDFQPQVPCTAAEIRNGPTLCSSIMGMWWACCFSTQSVVLPCLALHLLRRGACCGLLTPLKVLAKVWGLLKSYEKLLAEVSCSWYNENQR